MLNIFTIDDFAARYGEPVKAGTIIIVVLMILGQWKVFEKAGVAGWKSLIPIYNICKLLQISGRSMAGILIYLLLAIPLIGWLIVLYYHISVVSGLAKRFGHGFLFELGLLLFFPLFLTILGFDDSTYQED